GDYFLNKGGSTNVPMDLEELATEVAALIVTEPERPVVVKADRNIPYDKVIQLMVTLQQ
ncbi:biopolymer transporter ExbD, partial [Shewanella sp.]